MVKSYTNLKIKMCPSIEGVNSVVGRNRGSHS
ncbi:hypothetical protein E2C01_038696 [Portunus trituberculatus]|uniref:Uncharacterized protein n=1 Tax=Portunus trituberculatus TaxID=210409 RepID=A0A5B7FIQ1_PORTR|nr:hypothetical protein [Portunus trituberculatus]